MQNNALAAAHSRLILLPFSVMFPSSFFVYQPRNTANSLVEINSSVSTNLEISVDASKYHNPLKVI